jgi:molybdate transport system substrate-binding protein
VRFSGFVLSLVLAFACSKENRSKRIRVGAASDLARAFVEVGKEFKTRTGIEPEFDFGSSGLLAKQIEQSAPIYLYAAANKKFVDQVVKAGRCDSATARMYGRGRIVAWTRNGTPAPQKLEDLADPRYKRIAIANPEHAPYGVAAKQALERSGMWDKIKDRIVYGENIQATLVYGRDGNADVAIVALSLAVVTQGGQSLQIDQSLHDPLDQALVVCGKGGEADRARQLADFITSREGREIMSRYGFQLPDDKR